MVRKIIQLRRIAVAGFRNFFRNAWLSIAATAIMVVTLTIILASIVTNLVLSDNLNEIAQRVTVAVYLQDDVSQEDKDWLRDTLASSYNVASVRYINKDEALAIFYEQNRDKPDIASSIAITGNQLPESFEVSVIDLSQIDAVTNIANGEQFTDIVDETSVNETSKEAIDNIAKAQDFITLASIIGASLFASISILVIFNTIRMAVYTRSQEIEIMKLIGATPGYIRGPFLFEAALYGIFAGVITFITVYSALLSLGPRASKELLLDETIDQFASYWWAILVLTLLLGMVIGLISSYFATARYLRLKRW